MVVGPAAERRRWRLLPVALLAIALCARCDNDAAATAGTPSKIEIKASIVPSPVTVVEAEVDGRIRTIVNEGTPVAAGDVLVTLSNPGIDRDLAHARAQIAAAELRLAAASATSSPRNDSRVRAAATIMKNKGAKVERYRALFARRDISEQELREAENELAAAERDWLNERERSAFTTRADPDLLRLDLEKARADHLAASERQQALTLRAPVAGRVTRLFKRVNQPVYTREPLVELADTANAEIRAELAPELLRYVKAGSMVDVRVLSVPARRFRRPIARLDRGTPNSAPSLVVTVPNPDNALTAGLPATITIE